MYESGEQREQAKGEQHGVAGGGQGADVDTGSEGSVGSPEAVSVPPRVYVASLADYNAGRLHGVWLAADQDEEQLQAGVSAMLATSPEPGAEEWAIHDFEGFGPLRLGEYESLATVSTLARGIAEHGPAFAAWASYQDSLSTLLPEGFEQAYRGRWESVEAYAADLLEELGAAELLARIPDWLTPYVRLDSGGFARDLELGGDIVAIKGEGGVYVFDAHP